MGSSEIGTYLLRVHQLINQSIRLVLKGMAPHLCNHLHKFFEPLQIDYLLSATDLTSFNCILWPDSQNSQLQILHFSKSLHLGVPVPQTRPNTAFSQIFTPRCSCTSNKTKQMQQLGSRNVKGFQWKGRQYEPHTVWSVTLLSKFHNLFYWIFSINFFHILRLKC